MTTLMSPACSLTTFSRWFALRHLRLFYRERSSVRSLYTGSANPRYEITTLDGTALVFETWLFHTVTVTTKYTATGWLWSSRYYCLSGKYF
ncbi:hypothetical protein AB6A40_005254 [Gnathostoma spinigerum]|uniref:Uncharacterized protein n=1 Tax=Gnathostoma spinigerum TaxID=75299 RepID=A0ABD6EEW4_9BILA